MVGVESDALPEAPPRVAWARETVGHLRERIRDDGTVEEIADVVASAETFGTDAYWTYDVVIFLAVYERPRADPSGTSFEAGLAGGTAILYDYARDEIACAANFMAETTSENIAYESQMFNESYTLQHMLDAEFDAELERAVARAMQHRAALAPPGDAGVPDTAAH
jgi:hypothetical protein